MYVRRILEQVGDRTLVDVNGNGAQLIDAINAALSTPTLTTASTGTEVLAAFDTLLPVDQSRIESVAEDYIVTNFGTLPLNLTPPVAGGPARDYRAFIAVMMSIAIVAMAVTYISMVIYVSWHKLTIPDWSDIFIPFVTLGAVVWNYNGLLTRENRDAIAAGLGSVPGGVLASIVQAMAAARRPRT
jgi:hypothetical protein